MSTTTAKTNSANRQNGVHILSDSLQTRKIVIDLVGCGGTGTQVLTGLGRLHQALVALGHPFGLHVRVFDPDRVSPSNIGRQLFAHEDIGHRKATILVNRVNCFFQVDWEAFPVHYTGGMRDLGRLHPMNQRDADILITCVDTAAARREIGDYFRKMRNVSTRYWLDCGNQQHKGQVFLTEVRRVLELTTLTEKVRERFASDAILPPLWHLLPEIFDALIPEDNRPSCSLAEALEEQGLYINQHIATWALTLLEMLFRNGQLTTCGYWINPGEGTVASVSVRQALAKEALAKQAHRAKRGRRVATNG